MLVAYAEQDAKLTLELWQKIVYQKLFNKKNLVDQYLI